METGAFIAAVGGFAGGILAGVAWPTRGGARRLSLLSASIGCGAALTLASQVLMGSPSWHLELPLLFQPLGGFSLGLDQLGALFLALIAFTGIAASIYGIGYLRALDDERRVRPVLAMFNLFLAGMCLVPCADNVLTFLFGWELMALASYALVVSDPSDPSARSAGLWYAGMTQGGFVALLVAFLTFGQNGALDFASLRAQASTLSDTRQLWIFALAIAAFGSKAGLVPLHVWLPRAHPAAPSHVSALMSAAMVKLGVYGALRLLFDLIPASPAWWGGALLLVGLITAIKGVLFSVTETHLKRLLAYSTIENIGIVFVGIGFALLMRGYGYQQLAALGLVAALLHTVNHAAFKSLLFLSGGAVVHAAHHASLEMHGGLIKRMPQTALLCLIGVLSLAALPPLNGFTSEWLTFQFLVAGARNTAPELAIALPLALAALALTAGLAAVSAVRLFGISFLALPRSSGASHAQEAPAAMRFAMLLPAAACVLLGLLPSFAVRILAGIVAALNLPASPLSVATWIDVPLAGSRLWPAAVAVVLAGGGLGIVLLHRLRAPEIAVGSAWNCGRIAQSARTEYTATSFAEPLRRVFTWLYRPQQKVSVETHAASPYFVRSIEYEATVAPRLEPLLYAPIVRLIEWMSIQTRRLQAGSVHIYLAYVASMLFVMLLLSYWVSS